MKGDPSRCSQKIYLANKKNQISRLRDELFGYTVDYIIIASHLELYFTTSRRRLFFKLTEFRTAAESLRHSELGERKPTRPITGTFKLNSNMRRRQDSGNYERLFSLTASDRAILLDDSIRCYKCAKCY